MVVSPIIDWNNLKTNLTRFSQVKFRKSHEILHQFDKYIKSYIKMFEVVGLLGSPAQVGLKANLSMITHIFI